jgi:hypothetical protein
MGANFTIFETCHGTLLQLKPLSTCMSETDAVLYKVARPVIKTTPKNATCMPAANYLHAVADVSLFLRNFPDAISLLFSKALSVGGTSLIGFTSILYSVIAIAWARDSYKQMLVFKKIGDLTGVVQARLQIVENLFLSLGSQALTVVRGFATVKEVSTVLHNPITFSYAAVTAQTVAAWTSAAFFTFYFALFSWRQLQLLRGLSKGDELRDRILKSPDHLGALREEVNYRMHTQGKSREEVNLNEVDIDPNYEEIALEEGVKWLEKLEKEIDNRPWKLTLESRKEHVRQLFLTDPYWMMAEMGYKDCFENYEPDQIILAFGQFIAAKRLCTRIENDLSRLLGPEAIEAANKNDAVGFEKALKSADWSVWGVRTKAVLKIVLAVAGASAIIAGTIFSGGLALAIPLLVLGVIGILWIVLIDGSLFKSQWESGEVSKRDKVLIYLSVALSVLALAGLAAMTVATGGATLYVAGLVFAAAWLVINGRALVGMVNSQRHPWDYQKVPTIEAFRKLVRTNPSEEKIQEILHKMSVFDRKGLIEQKQHNSWRKAARLWSDHIQAIKKTNLEMLKDGLEEASLGVKQINPNLVVAI